jgi:hypothetical protein
MEDKRAEYRKNNKDKIHAYQRKWREEHPEYVESLREWRKQNQEVCLGYWRKYREANREKRRLSDRLWKERNPDKVYPHRKIWEDRFKVKIPVDENGELFCIHHKDGNHKNNAPDNLLCLSRSEHTKLHAKK